MEPLYSEETIDLFVHQATQYLVSLRSRRYGLPPDRPLTRLLPPEIRQHMTELVLEDLDEMAYCVAGSLWTAATLMACRILEETVMVHVSEDLGISVRQLTLEKAIDRMKQTFQPAFIRQVQTVRRTRNDAMHAARRFQPTECLATIQLVLWLSVYVFSIPPRER